MNLLASSAALGRAAGAVSSTVCGMVMQHFPGQCLNPFLRKLEVVFPYYLGVSWPLGYFMKREFTFHLTKFQCEKVAGAALEKSGLLTAKGCSNLEL